MWVPLLPHPASSSAFGHVALSPLGGSRSRWEGNRGKVNPPQWVTFWVLNSRLHGLHLLEGGLSLWVGRSLVQ